MGCHFDGNDRAYFGGVIVDIAVQDELTGPLRIFCLYYYVGGVGTCSCLAV